ASSRPPPILADSFVLAPGRPIMWRILRPTLALCVLCSLSVGRSSAGEETRFRVTQTDRYVQVDTDILQARVNKKGYVSGTAAGNFLDKKTGARDVGFGLHIMDFLLAPGWRDDDYSRDPKGHGHLPKHHCEAPHVSTPG